MITLSHRGFWTLPEEKNRATAFARSFESGFGTETDIRDRGGDLIISHDMPQGGELALGEVLQMMEGRDLPLAINIKADGLAKSLLEIMRAAGHTNWFTFDMAVPDMIAQLRLGIPVFTRCSEYEPAPVCLDCSAGVWLDGFESEWYSMNDIAEFLRLGKKVCIVSPELHGRDPEALWNRLVKSGMVANSDLMICTDRPDIAAPFLGG